MRNNPAFTELFFSKTMDYLDIYLSRQNKKSQETIKAYRIALTNFYIYVTEVRNIKVIRFCFTDCTYEFVLSYSQYLQEEKNLGNSAVNQKLAAIKSYIKYVSDGDISLMQVYLSVKNVPLLKLTKRQRQVLEKDDLKVLMNSMADTKMGNRDRMIIILLFDTAVRASELLGITLGDISLDITSPYIIIHGKGKKERSVTLNKKTTEHLRGYISRYHKPGAPSDTPLFFTTIHGQMNHMSERNLERIVKKYGEAVLKKNTSLTDSIYPHMLRRSRASGLYRDGVPIEMVAAILGHSSTETTKIYAIPSVQQMREAIEKGQPEPQSAERLWEGKEEKLRRMFGLN